MNDEQVDFRLTPKGAILYALGGYEKKKLADSEKVHNSLVDYMTRFDMAIMVKDGKLDFIPIKRQPNKWWQFWKP